MNSKLEDWTERGSNWVLKEVLGIHVHIAAYSPLRGSSYLPLPDYIKKKKAVINVQNADDKCFMWSLLAALHPAEPHAERVSKYVDHVGELKFDGVEFPVELKDITKIEKMNGLAINVFG